MARMNDGLPSVTGSRGGMPTSARVNWGAPRSGSAMNDSLPGVSIARQMQAGATGGTGSMYDMMSAAARTMGGYTTGPANTPQPGAGGLPRLQNPFDLQGARGS